MMQIRDELTMLRYRSNNTFSCPIVIRVPIGGYLRGGAPVSQPVRREHLRALPRHPHRVSRRTRRTRPACCAPSIRCDDPVLFLEHKHLYRQTYNKGDYPGRRLHGAVRQGGGPPRRRPTSSSSPGARWCSARCSRRSRPRRTASASMVIDLRTIMPFDWDDDRRGGRDDQPRRHRARGSADLRFRRRARGPHRRRALRAPRRAGAARRRAGHAGRLLSRTSKKRSCRSRPTS